ncbi:MAG: hypothetical protein ACI8Z1_002279, partial [Candidatus Azotimanducaceae bacterium]
KAREQNMKYAIWIVVAILGLLATLGTLQFAASERIEVVELQTKDSDGVVQTTRLWVVDYEGTPYLRGESNSGWYKRLNSSDLVNVTRAGQTGQFRTSIDNNNIGVINSLMRDKYTWGDDFFATMLGSRDASNAIRLTAVYGVQNQDAARE